jgi:hypothetical protein
MIPSISHNRLAHCATVNGRYWGGCIFSIMTLRWNDILTLLTQNGSDCAIRLLDTVFKDKLKYTWYYTTKSGSVSKKKKEKSTLTDILTRFNKFALSNPHNLNGYVATIISSDGSNRVFTSSELEIFLQQDYNNNEFLQVYLRPQGGVNQTLKVFYNFQSMHKMDYFLVSSDHPDPVESRRMNPGDAVCNQASTMLSEIVRSVEKINLSSCVKTLSAEFIIDDNGHVWLSRVPDAVLVDKDSLLSPDPVSVSLSEPLLPNISSSRSGIDTAKNVAIFPKPLLRREGGVFLSSFGPEDLPGLRAWVLTTLSDNPAREDWTIDLEMYRDITGPSKSLQGVRQSRSQLRRSVPALLVSLVDSSDALLVGTATVTDEEDFRQRWKQAYRESLASEASRRAPIGDVSVCGNCHAICAKIQSLISVEFRSVSPKVSFITWLIIELLTYPFSGSFSTKF